MKKGKWLAAGTVDPQTAIDRIEHQRKNPKVLSYKFNPDGTLDYFHKWSGDGATRAESLHTREVFNEKGHRLYGEHESPNYSIRSWESHETPGQQHFSVAKKNKKSSAPNMTYDTLTFDIVDPAQHKNILINEVKKEQDLYTEMADVLVPAKGKDPKLKTFAVEPFALSAEDRLKDLPKGLPTKFADVEGYLKNVQLKNTGIALAVGAALGGLAYLGITQVGKKPKVEPTSYPLKDGASPTA
jgi:hypothetical protein